MYSTLQLVLCIVPSVLAVVGPVHIPLRHRTVTPTGIERYAIAAERLRHKYGYASSPKAKRQGLANIPMTNQYGDSGYFASLSIGTPGQDVNVVLDTGSSDLWVVSSQCQSCVPGAPTFDQSKSSTFRMATGPSSRVEIDYGSGSVSGNVVEDTVNMGGFTVGEQILVSVDESGFGSSDSGSLIYGSASGILGLGFQQIAVTNAVPFWYALTKAGNLLQSPEMSFAFTRLINKTDSMNSEDFGGTFTLGGTNSTLFTGDIEFLNVTSGDQPGYWTLPLKALTVGGTTVKTSSGSTALSVIDTGTTLIAGPTADVDAFWRAVPGSAPVDFMDGFFSYPCKSQLNVTVSFGGTAWPISEADMNLGQVEDGSSQCVGGMFDLSAATPIGSSLGPGWIFGDTFLKNVYSVLRATPPQIGFARLSSGANNASGSPTSTSSKPGATNGGGGGGTGGGSGSAGGGVSAITPLSPWTISLSVFVGIIDCLRTFV